MNKNLLLIFHDYKEFKKFINKVYDIMHEKDCISTKDMRITFGDSIKNLMVNAVDLGNYIQWDRVISLNKLPDSDAFSVIFTDEESNVDTVVKNFIDHYNLDNEIINDLKTIIRIYSKY